MLKLVLFQLVCLLSIHPSFANNGTLADSKTPDFYLKRTEPVMNIALIYYGNERNEADLSRIKALLESRFYLATHSMIKLNATISLKIPYRHQIQNYPEYHLPNITDLARLQRLWYYDNVNEKIMDEVYDESKNAPVLKSYLPGLDALVVMTGAQFDGLGYADGRVAVTESPREIAWGLPDGGYTEETHDGSVVDELIHEIGHTLFLGHASTQCFKSGMTPTESRECCALSPNKDDVMSYCRARAQVNDTNFFYGFKDCNLHNIKNLVIPAMLLGGAWKLNNREVCL